MLNRVLVQEFGYWVIGAYWNIPWAEYSVTPAPGEGRAEIPTLGTREHLQAKYPELVPMLDRTVGMTMALPSAAALTKLREFKQGQSAGASACPVAGRSASGAALVTPTGTASCDRGETAKIVKVKDDPFGSPAQRAVSAEVSTTCSQCPQSNMGCFRPVLGQF